MKLKDLVPHPGNPRKIDQWHLDALKKSLAEFGDLGGIIFNKTTGRLVGGHQRIKVLPPDAEIELTGENRGFVKVGNDYFTYREVEWDENKEKAANIAANKHGGEWDIPALTTWLNELDAANIDMDLTGFNSEELENMMAPKVIPGLTDEDAIPEKVEPKAKLGDIYQLGNHRLMCGDSTSIDAVEKLMNGEKADMVFTDPPYNQSKSGGGFNDSRPGWSEHKEDQLNDFQPEEIFPIFEISGAQSGYFFCNKSLLTKYLEWADSVGGWDLLVMGKENPIPTKHKKFLSDIEYIVFVRNSGAYFDDSLEYDYYRKVRMVSVKAREFGHPTEKQVGVIEPFLCVSSVVNGKVLDLFGGSGSTLIACEKTNRKCFMMELDPHYIDVIITRWQNYTGQQAVLLNQAEEPNMTEGLGDTNGQTKAGTE